MGNLLAKGARWLAQKQSRHAASDVEYRRGGSVTVLRAMAGQTSFDETENGAATLDASMMDWLIEVPLLILDGVQTEPIAGDTITDPDSGKVWTVASTPNSHCWRYSTEQQAQYRIHVKLNSVEQ